MRRCRVKLLTGYASGICEPAVFKSWKAREISRLDQRSVTHSKQASYVIAEVAGVDLASREHMVGIGLDKRNRVIAIADGSSGQESICLFRMADMLKALYDNVRVGSDISAIVIGHNHPSGDVTASSDDMKTTRFIMCNFQGIGLMDHVIVGPGSVSSSMREDDPPMFATRTC